MRTRVVLILFFLTQLGFAQVGIGTLEPNVGASLDIVGTDKGILIPRTTPAAITVATNGLLIYDTDRQCISQNIGTVSEPNWVCISGNVVRFFYMPTIALDISLDTGSGVGRTKKLFEEYKKQFSEPKAQSPGAKGIPFFNKASDLEYYVLNYNEDIFTNVSIDIEGVLTYSVTDQASNIAKKTAAFMNVVFVVKQ